MAEKKTTKAVATTKKATAQKKETATKKVAEKKNAIEYSALNVGFKAGDVYQALATAEKALSVAEIAKAANISKEEALLGMGWLLKEGKIKDEGAKVVLA